MTIHTLANNYADSFPQQVPVKAAQGFVATAAIHLFLGGVAKVALLGGAIAATATLIEAVTRPIIRAIFPEHRFIGNMIQIVVPQIAAVGLATAIAPWIGITYKITNHLVPLVAWLMLNQDYYERNVGMATVL